MGILQKIGELYFAAMERLLGGSSKPESIEDRRFFGIKAGVGVAGVAAQSSGIHVEGMKPEEALDFLALLKEKMMDVDAITWKIGKKSSELEGESKRLLYSIIDQLGLENKLSKLTRIVAKSDTFDPAIDVHKEWLAISKRHKDLLEKSISEVIQAVGDKSIKIPTAMLNSTSILKMPVDEDGRIHINAISLQQAYDTDTYEEMLKQLP